MSEVERRRESIKADLGKVTGWEYVTEPRSSKGNDSERLVRSIIEEVLRLLEQRNDRGKW